MKTDSIIFKGTLAKCGPLNPRRFCVRAVYIFLNIGVISDLGISGRFRPSARLGLSTRGLQIFRQPFLPHPSPKAPSPSFCCFINHRKPGHRGQRERRPFGCQPEPGLLIHNGLRPPSWLCVLCSHPGRQPKTKGRGKRPGPCLMGVKTAQRCWHHRRGSLHETGRHCI